MGPPFRCRVKGTKRGGEKGANRRRKKSVRTANVHHSPVEPGPGNGGKEGRRAVSKSEHHSFKTKRKNAREKSQSSDRKRALSCERKKESLDLNLLGGRRFCMTGTFSHVDRHTRRLQHKNTPYGCPYFYTYPPQRPQTRKIL